MATQPLPYQQKAKWLCNLCRIRESKMAVQPLPSVRKKNWLSWGNLKWLHNPCNIKEKGKG